MDFHLLHGSNLAGNVVISGANSNTAVASVSGKLTYNDTYDDVDISRSHGWFAGTVFP